MGIEPVTVDATDLLEGYQTLEGNLSSAGLRALNRAANILRGSIRGIMLETYEHAVIAAGPGFFPQYANHLRHGIYELNVLVEVNEPEITVSVGDIEDLGGWEDIEETFHYHAILDIGDSSEFSVSNPPLSDMGTDVGDLYGPNHTDNRADFWSAILVGADYEVRLRGWTGVVSTAGMLEETLNARVAAWGNRYPEWILLDEGMSEGEPTIEPTGFVEAISARIEGYIEEVIDSVADKTYQDSLYWDAIIPPVYDERIGAHGGYRASSGRFIKRPTS